MPKWKTLSREEVFKTKRSILFRELISDGSIQRNSTFLTQLHSGVCIIPYFENINSFILVRQFRNPLKKEIWQFPAGGTDKGETPLSAAKREFFEETGYSSDSLVKLGKFHPDAELLETDGSFFLALNPIKKSSKASQSDEKVICKIFSEEQILNDISSGKIRDGWTLSAFCLFLIWKNKG